MDGPDIDIARLRRDIDGEISAPPAGDGITSLRAVRYEPEICQQVLGDCRQPFEVGQRRVGRDRPDGPRQNSQRGGDESRRGWPEPW